MTIPAVSRRNIAIRLAATVWTSSARTTRGLAISSKTQHRERTRCDAQGVSSGRRDAADLALEDRIGEWDRTHRPHLAALQRRRHEGAEGRRTARLDDQIVATREEPVGNSGHREPVEIAWGT